MIRRIRMVALDLLRYLQEQGERYLQEQGELLSHMECAARSIKSRLPAEPRMVMAVS